MATEAQLIEGIKRADAAGDADSVKALGSALIKMRAPKAPAKSDSAVGGVIAGAIKPFDNAALALSKAPVVGPALDWVADKTGMMTADQAYAKNQAARQNNTRTGYQALGNIIGTGAIQAATRGKGGAFLQGAGSGALLSDADNPTQLALDSTIGGAFGKGGQMLANGLSYLAKPVVSKGSQLLYDAGIPQTLGQIAGQGKGLAARTIAGAENAITSIPLIGDMVKGARDQGTNAFNLALGNRILSNIGKKLPATIEAGDDMIKHVGDQLSAKYTALVPKLSASFDNQFATDLGAAKAMTRTIPNGKQTQFAKIVDDVFTNRASGSTLNGQALKDAESKLTALTKEYRNAADPDQRIMANAIERVRQGLRSMVARSNPAHADELQALNKGWAQLGQLRKAASAPGNATGFVTPAQALSASKKAQFDDKLIKAAKAILPNTTPDSGTAGRAAWGMLATGAGGGLGALANPALAAPAAASVLYTKPGMKALNSLVFAPRPPVLQTTAQALRAFGKVAPGVVPALLPNNK